MGDARLEKYAQEAAKKLLELLQCEKPDIALKSAELILKGAGLLREKEEAAGIERWQEIVRSCIKRMEGADAGAPD